MEGGVWGAWVNLGGYWTSDPSATSSNSGSVVVCARGDDGAFWWNYVMDGGVTAPQWYSSGGQLLAGTGVAAFSSGEWDGEWACFAAVGTNHQLYWYTTSATWQSLGGYLTASPAGASTSAGVFDVFARGSNGALYEKTSTNGGGTWGAWASLGGQLASGTGPAACSWGSGRLDVFVQGTDGALWHKWWNGAKWSGWESLGGKLTSSPTAASRSSGTINGICARHRQWPLEEDLQRWVVRLNVRLGVVHFGCATPHRARQKGAFSLPFSSFLFPEQASL